MISGRSAKGQAHIREKSVHKGMGQRWNSRSQRAVVDAMGSMRNTNFCMVNLPQQRSLGSEQNAPQAQNSDITLPYSSAILTEPQLCLQAMDAN